MEFLQERRMGMSSQLPDKKRNRDKEPFGDLIKSMNQFFNERPVKGFLESIDEFFNYPFPHLSFPIDVAESKNEYIITAELPGVRKEQIQIDTIGSRLTISIKNDEEIIEDDEIHRIHRRRKTLQQSSRSINLPFPINEKQVKATYKDGLLQIRLPLKSGKSIQIE